MRKRRYDDVDVLWTLNITRATLCSPSKGLTWDHLGTSRIIWAALFWWNCNFFMLYRGVPCNTALQ